MQWNPPRGNWAVSIGALICPPTAIAHAGTEYDVVVATLCGKEDVKLVAMPRTTCDVEQFARQVQLAASIHHVLRRECTECMLHYGQTLTPHERKFLYTSDPRLGRVLGLGGAADAIL
jgi:hypothetical protein